MGIETNTIRNSAAAVSSKRGGKSLNNQVDNWNLLAHRNSKVLFMQGSGGEFELLTEAADLTITSPSNFYRWENEEYEALWLELQTALDADRRMESGYRDAGDRPRGSSLDFPAHPTGHVRRE